MSNNKTISIEEYEEARESYIGFCIDANCDGDREMVEPDAEKYECPVCEQLTIYGADHFLICDLIH